MGNIKSIRFEYISLPTDIGHIQFDHPVQTLVAVLGAFELNERAPHSNWRVTSFLATLLLFSVQAYRRVLWRQREQFCRYYITFISKLSCTQRINRRSEYLSALYCASFFLSFFQHKAA